MNKNIFNQKYIILIISIILLLGLGLIINSSLNTQDIVVNYITQNKAEQNNLENMNLSVVYGSTYNTDYISYAYKSKKFKKENERFWVSINNTIDKNILELLWDDKTYEDILIDTGQVSFYKIIGDYIYIIFDGYFTSTSNQKKDNIIYKVSLLDGSYEKFNFNSDHSFFSYDIYEYNNEIYISGLLEVLDEDNNKSLKNVILYKINKNDITRIDIMNTDKLVKIESYMFINGNFYFSVWNEGYEHIYIYDIDNNKIINEMNTNEIELYQEYKDYIVLFSTQENKLKMSFYDIGLEEKQHQEFDIGSYNKIKETFLYEKQIYILIEKDLNNHILYTYDYLNKKLIKLIDFSLVNNPNNLFLYDIYRNEIKK